MMHTHPDVRRGALAVIVMSAFGLTPTYLYSASLGAPQVRSSLGERLDLLVPVRVAEGESVSTSCFSLQDGSGGGDVVQIMTGSLSYSAGGGKSMLRVQSSGPILEPMIQLTLKVQCEGTTGSSSRTYTLFVDPKPELANVPVAPSASAGLSPGSAKGTTDLQAPLIENGKWIVQTPENLQQVLRYHYPQSRELRRKMLYWIRTHNQGLPRNRYASLPAGKVLSLPTDEQVRSVKLTTWPPSVQTATSGQQTIKAPRSRLELSSAPAQSAPLLPVNASEAELQAHEKALLLQADDQVARLLELKAQVSRLERTLEQMHQTASASSPSVQPPVTKPAVVEPAAAPLTKPNPVDARWGFLVAGGLTLAAVLAAGVMLLRRKGTPKDEMDALDSVQLAPTALRTNAEGHSAPASKPLPPSATPNVLPVAGAASSLDVVQPSSLSEEIELLMAHGQVDAASSLLEEAIEAEPDRALYRFWQLEIHCAQKNVMQFRLRADAFHRQFPKSTLWVRICEMGRQLEADDPLYAPVAEIESEPVDLSGDFNREMMEDLLLQADGAHKAPVSTAVPAEGGVPMTSPHPAANELANVRLDIPALSEEGKAGGMTEDERAAAFERVAAYIKSGNQAAARMLLERLSQEDSLETLVQVAETLHQLDESGGKAV